MLAVFAGQRERRSAPAGETASHGRPGWKLNALDCIVTIRFFARALQASVTAPVPRVMDAWAMMVPTVTEPTPRGAELPTAQNTLDACAPPVRTTEPRMVSPVPT